MLHQGEQQQASCAPSSKRASADPRYWHHAMQGQKCKPAGTSSADRPGSLPCHDEDKTTARTKITSIPLQKCEVVWRRNSAGEFEDGYKNAWASLMCRQMHKLSVGDRSTHGVTQLEASDHLQHLGRIFIAIKDHRPWHGHGAAQASSKASRRQTNKHLSTCFPRKRDPHLSHTFFAATVSVAAIEPPQVPFTKQRCM